MERARPARPSDEGSIPETIGPLPSRASLPVLLDVVRSPGVVKTDVDALLQGLARPLAEGEDPRTRADLLLSLIEARDVGDMQGNDGRTVRAAAMQALLDMGYPYALEVPPEALAEARGLKEERGKRKIPIPGLIATLAGLVVQSAYGLPPVLKLLRERDNLAIAVGVFALGALLGPTSSAVLGGLLRLRRLQELGIVTMTITGVIWMILFLLILTEPRPLFHEFTYEALVAGLGFLLGAVHMSAPGWHVEEEPPKGDRAPPTKP